MRSAEQTPEKGNRFSSLLVPVLLGLAVLGGIYHFLSGDGDAVTSEPSSPLAAPVPERGEAPALRPSSGSGRARTPDAPAEWSVTAEPAPELATLPGYPVVDRPRLPPEVYEDETAIGGRVLDLSGKPLEGVPVVLEVRGFFDPERSAGMARGRILTATSNAEGFFAFLELEPGLYRLHADPAADYLPNSRMVRTGVYTANLVLEETKAFEVHGVVTTREGEPLAGVRVFQGDRPDQRAFTDSRGGYSLEMAVGDGMPNAALRYQLKDYRERRVLIGEAEWRDQDAMQVDVALDDVPPWSGIRERFENSATESDESTTDAGAEPPPWIVRRE